MVLYARGLYGRLYSTSNGKSQLVKRILRTGTVNTTSELVALWNDAGGVVLLRWIRSTQIMYLSLRRHGAFKQGDTTTSTGNGAEDQLTPLQVGDKVFLCTPHNNIIALDADTGNKSGKLK